MGAVHPGVLPRHALSQKRLTLRRGPLEQSGLSRDRLGGVDFVARRMRSIGETFKTIGELVAFLTRRGQWWLLPVLAVALIAAAGLAVGQLGVFSFIYVIF